MESSNRTSRKVNENGLNIRQEEFALECAKNGDNASAAYRVVYGQGNMSDKTLNEMASRLRRKVDARFQEIVKERRKRSIIQLEESNQILSAIARANPKDTMYRDPKTGKSKMRSPEELSEDTANAISIMTNDKGRVSYRFHSKLKALEQLARQNGWNSETTHHDLTSKDSGEFRFGFKKKE